MFLFTHSTVLKNRVVSHVININKQQASRNTWIKRSHVFDLRAKAARFEIKWVFISLMFILYLNIINKNYLREIKVLMHISTCFVWITHNSTKNHFDELWNKRYYIMRWFISRFYMLLIILSSKNSYEIK